MCVIWGVYYPARCHRPEAAGIFHGGVSAPQKLDSAVVDFPVSKALLLGRSAHMDAYPVDNRELKQMSEQTKVSRTRFDALSAPVFVCLFYCFTAHAKSA